MMYEHTVPPTHMLCDASSNSFGDTLELTRCLSQCSPGKLLFRYAREIMDIFSFAYPTHTAGAHVAEAVGGEKVVGRKYEGENPPRPVDLFMEIREQLDMGYETIGVFQDLSRRHDEMWSVCGIVLN